MSDYTKTYDGAAKDSGESVLAGSDFDTEFNSISTAIATKSNKVGSPTDHNLLMMNASGDLEDSGIATDGAGVLTLSTPTLTSPVINTGVSGTAIDTDTSLAADSDTLLPSQKAVKAYVDGKDFVTVLDVPTLEHTGTGGLSLNAWNTFTLSGLPAGTTHVLIGLEYTTTTTATQGEHYVEARETGTSPTNPYKFIDNRDNYPTVTSRLLKSSGTMWVAVNGSKQIDLYLGATTSGAALNICDLYAIAYK